MDVLTALAWVFTAWAALLYLGAFILIIIHNRRK